MTRIFLSAGEASGEQYGMQLMGALRERLGADAEFFGLGGRRMEALGFRRVVKAEDVAVMGITEIVRHIPKILREYRRLKRSLTETRPDVAVLIDFPDVNLALAKECKRLGIPTVFFVSPQVWAWKKHRLPGIRRNVDRMLVIFPFEEQWYRERGVEAAFVGHPLAELPLPTVERARFAAEHALDASKPWIGLLPGSRGKEIALNLPTMLEAAAQLGDGYEYVLPLAATLTAEHEARVQQLMAAQPGVRVTLTRDARGALHHARASVVASGTATVEAALIGNPFVVVYRLSGASYAVAKRVVKVPHVAMANLIANERLVPELIQDVFTADAVVTALQPLLDETPERARMMDGLQRVRVALHGRSGAIQAVAEHVISFVPASKLPAPSSSLH